MKNVPLDQLSINTLRMLSIDAVQKAKSGHPGTPLDAAPMAYCLWQRFLRYDPADPDWPNRDRFVLAAGHAFRAMPGMVVLRPADANEVAEAWKVIMHLKDRPVCLVLTRQAVPTLDRSTYANAGGVAQSAYALADAPDGKPDVLLLATGSEVALCVTAYEQLKAEGIKARVVSMPSWEFFESQPKEYRDTVLPPTIKARVAVEEASGFGWERYTGFDGAILALHSFGLSAPSKVVAEHFGFEPAHLVAAAKAQIAGRRSTKQVGIAQTE